MIRLEGVFTADGPRDFVFDPGDVVLLRGPNGSGKTSLLRAIAGFDAPVTPRSVALAGDDPRTMHAPTLARAVRYVPQDARDALAGLTVAGEFRLRERPPPLYLAALASRDVATLSTGESRRVGIALAAGSTAPLLLLDEPLEGLDPVGRARVRALVSATRDARGVVVLVDHDGLLSDLATRTLELAPTTRSSSSSMDAPPFHTASSKPRLEAPAATVRRGAATVNLPSISLSSGFHTLEGPNGSGKSSFLLHLAGLLGAPSSRVDGATPSCGRHIRFLPPHARDLLAAPTVGDELTGVDAAVADAFVPRALRARHPLALSGGEQQRVALAVTLGAPAPVYLLDEPEAHLDAHGRALLTRLLAQRILEGSCVLAATHDGHLHARAHTRIELKVNP